MTAAPDDIATLIANGFEPLLCDGKRPVAAKWSRRPNTLEALAEERAAHPNAANIGLRTGALVGGDIDLTDRAHATEIEKVFYSILGETPFRRVGAKGCLLAYRNENPISKITIGTRDKRLVEVLGSGQQFVAYGVHPHTGKEYEWSNDFLGGEPLFTPLSGLPVVSPELLYNAARAVAVKLIALGYGDVTISGIKTASAAASSVASGKAVTPRIIENMLRRISPAGDRNAWLVVCGGLVSAPVADSAWNGLDLFLRWSRGDLHGGTVPANYKGPEDCEAQWQRDVEKLHDR